MALPGNKTKLLSSRIHGTSFSELDSSFVHPHTLLTLLTHDTSNIGSDNMPRDRVNSSGPKANLSAESEEKLTLVLMN